MNKYGLRKNNSVVYYPIIVAFICLTFLVLWNQKSIRFFMRNNSANAPLAQALDSRYLSLGVAIPFQSLKISQINKSNCQKGNCLGLGLSLVEGVYQGKKIYGFVPSVEKNHILERLKNKKAVVHLKKEQFDSFITAETRAYLRKFSNFPDTSEHNFFDAKRIASNR